MTHIVSTPFCVEGTPSTPALMSLCDGTYNSFVRSPSPMTQSSLFILPKTTGTNGQFLSTDGLGETSWEDTHSSPSSGFSASATVAIVGNTAQLFSNYSTSSPYFPGTGFNAVSGTFTVPSTGRYNCEVTISYSTTSTVTASLGPTVAPYFAVQRLSTNLIAGFIPMLDVNVALVLNLRVILGKGTVTLDGDLDLVSGDVLGVYYVPNGLTIPLNISNASGPGVVWSMKSLF